MEVISDSKYPCFVMYLHVTEAFVFVSYDGWTSTHHITWEAQSPSERLRQGAGHHNGSGGQKLFPVHMLGGLRKGHLGAEKVNFSGRDLHRSRHP